ncbi:hypothetical protein IVA78_28450 [Bradyrhizobium sp. 137]|uniref:hypothetical protein n=1 Tax=Bradyrhizobium sp. 137 TaxID=2782614 RepID=UPI001FF7F9B8|nr:hypothetical protein [Bradyrhizobium sp. 137]MCK1758985.1 hypothetical protein [Bradyrhizobium sp. 137]
MSRRGRPATEEGRRQEDWKGASAAETGASGKAQPNLVNSGRILTIKDAAVDATLSLRRTAQRYTLPDDKGLNYVDTTAAGQAQIARGEDDHRAQARWPRSGGSNARASKQAVEPMLGQIKQATDFLGYSCVASRK